jgi:hypothetical protein
MSTDDPNKRLSVALDRLRLTVRNRLDDILRDRKLDGASPHVETVKVERPMAASYVNLISRLFRIQRP